MDIEQLKLSIKKALEAKRPKQAVINSHLKDFDYLIHDLGYKLPAIVDILELDLNPEHLRSLLRVARKKAKDKNLSTSQSNLPQSKSDTQSPKKQPISDTELEQWKIVFHDISPNLVKDIKKLKLSVDDVKQLVKKHSILDTFQLRKRINELQDDLRASKFQ